MAIDCHVHLDDVLLQGFIQSYENCVTSNLRIISNSVDPQSSKRNVDLARRFAAVSALVGIHPEVVLRSGTSIITDERLDEMCKDIQLLSESSSGIGEIGLDSKYGSMSLQRRLFERQLEIAESNTSLVVTLHTRETISDVIEELSRYRIKNCVLFHWFSGTEQDLKKVHSLGYYTSFGLPVLYSKRIARLVLSADQELLLAESDSPVVFESISGSGPLTPFAVTSVIFGMSVIRGVSFDEMLRVNDANADMYLKRKTH